MPSTNRIRRRMSGARKALMRAWNTPDYSSLALRRREAGLAGLPSSAASSAADSSAVGVLSAAAVSVAVSGSGSAVALVAGASASAFGSGASASAARASDLVLAALAALGSPLAAL